MSDEKPQPAASDPADGTPPPAQDAAPQPDPYDYHPPTDGFPAYEPAPAAGTYPTNPQWSAAPPAPVAVRLRLRDHLLVAFSMVLALALVSLVSYMWVGGSAIVRPVANEAQSTGDSAPAGASDSGNAQQPAPAASGVDLTQNAVFVASNDAKANEVAAFSRNENGSLREVGRFQTGGKGSGTLEDVSQALILGTWEGESSPTQTVDKAELLFVPNLGSNTISVFRVKADGLELASTVPSGGEKPVSMTVSKGLLYVLNSGEFDDRFILGPDTPPLENCTTGQIPTVSGFRVAQDGTLTPIEGSTRALTEERDSGCAQIGFTPDGKTLVATERRAGKTDPASGLPKGAILTYAVKENGTLAPPVVNEAAGNGPYGFTFTKDGVMLVAEQNGADKREQGGQISSYTINADGTLTTLDGPLITLGTDTCWVVLHDNQRLAFVSNPLGGGTIGSVGVNNAKLSLLHPAASSPSGTDGANDNVDWGVLDVALSRDSKFLYALDGFAAGIYVFGVNENGTLTFVERKQVFDILPLLEGGSGGPNGLSAF